MRDPTQSPEGLWEALGEAESAASALLLGRLKPFREPVRDCYEAGVQSQCLLPCARRSTTDLRVAALYLKRVLMDLRATWLLCIRGYTSQAAAVAASLFENALASEIVSGDPEKAAQCLEEPTGGLPWSVREMTNLRVPRREAAAQLRGQTFTDTERLSAGDITYYTYRWLCKMKHPTTPSLVHDASGTKLGDRTFVVMALPNVHEDDLTLKGLILTDVVLEAKSSVHAFAEAHEPDRASPAHRDFAERMEGITPQLSRAFHDVCSDPAPFLLDQHSYAIRALRDPFQDR